MTNKRVYTSGVSLTDRAMAKDKPLTGETLSKGKQLNSVYEPLPSQKYTFQRGLAIAALELPEQERAVVLAEALASMDLLVRIMPRHTRGDR